MSPQLPTAEVLTCPTAQEWRAALLGMGDRQHWDAIEAHLLQCSRCEATVDALTEPSDTCVRALCQQPSTADDEPVFRSLYQRLIASDVGLDVSRELQEPLTLPFRLGNYELVSPLGHGANGSVFKARHVPLDRDVAIKLLRPDDDFDSAGVQRFMQEVRAVGRLDHPHVVRATDAGEINGRHFLVMEYVPGVDLSAVVATCGPLAVADACEVIRQSALALSYLHSHGFVHRDVKPSNLLLTADGQTKLLDLGLVQAATDEGHHANKNVPHGTADYMPPEQWLAFDRVEPRSDLYCLGCTLFKLLTGSPPFRPLPAGFETKSSAHCGAPIPSLADAGADVPDIVQRLLERLLAKEPADRLSSAAELIRHVEPLARGADLCRLALQAGLQPVQSSVNADNSSRPPRLLTRRQALVVASVAGVAALGSLRIVSGVARQRNAGPRVKTRQWRPLSLVSPEVLATPLSDEALWQQPDSNTLRVRSSPSQRVLLNLGQPVVGQYRLAVELVTPIGHRNAGLFFKFATTRRDGRLTHDFQSLELVRDDAEAGAHQLVWSDWRVFEDQGHFEIGRHTLLAGTRVTLPNMTAPLAVRCGRQGFPEIWWGDTFLPASDWNVSFEGQEQSALPKKRLATEFFGHVGLVAGDPEEPGNDIVITEFRQPRLAYERAS